MSQSLGLSVGVANMVAARIGSAPVSRSSVLTLFEHGPTEIGLPEENPNLTQPGLTLRGFVERVGDRSPLVAADGTKYLGEVLTVEAVEAMARTVGYGTPVTIAVPAYWSDAQLTALREEFFAQPDLARGDVPPVLVSDATAAIAALRSQPGFMTDGVVAVCDFGAGGTSVTLMNAGSNFSTIGSLLRDTEFSGDAIDQLVLDHVRAAAVAAAGPATSARTGAQTRLLGECRRAKERLSTASASTVAWAPGGDIPLSRNEFERIITEPLDRFLRTVDEALRRNAIPSARLSAVAAVGGGASIPLLTARLSQRFQVPAHTAPQPAFTAAVGAAVLGAQQAAEGVVVETPTEMVGTAATDMTNAAWAAPARDVDGARAWSEDADGTDEPVPYTGRDATGEYAREATEVGYAEEDRDGMQRGGLPWYKRTALILGVAGAVTAILVAVVLAVNLGHTKSNPATTTPANPPAPPHTSQTVTVTGPNDSTTATLVPPPPPPSTPPPASTTTAPATTTSTAPSQATTTEAPTTTSPTTPSPVSPTGVRPRRRY